MCLKTVSITLLIRKFSLYNFPQMQWNMCAEMLVCSFALCDEFVIQNFTNINKHNQHVL